MLNRTPKGGYNQEPGFDRVVDGKIYIGIVKNNKDSMKAGRLEVWIPEMGGEPDDPSKWHIVSYASPFAGATSVKDTVEDSQVMAGSQKTYGWWAVPPDLENQVLCCFVNGESTKGFWFACLWQQNMNHMVPGVASNYSYQEGEQGIMPPVVEYNKNQSSVKNIDPMKPRRPRFDPLHNGLSKQDLYTDFERGPASTSARREQPSKAFGLLTPRANQLYIDDDPDNEFIRLRTRGGTQVLIHETNGYVYINSGNGNAWVEVSDLGIDIYTKNSLSIRTELDLNIRSERDVNIDAGRNVNIRAGANILMQAGDSFHGTGANDVMFTAGNNMQLKATTSMIQSASSLSRKGQIADNGSAATATTASKPRSFTQIDYKHTTKDTIVSRMPHHEPWAGHPKSKEQEMPRGDLHAVPPRGNGEDVLPYPVNSAAATSSAAPTKNQKTGDGSTKAVPFDPSKYGTAKVGNKNIPAVSQAAIAKASSITGVSYGYMMAMADKESGFDPNAKAPKGSASGLYQFTDSTWAGMVKKYPEYGYTVADKNDPEAQAVMAGVLAKENKAVIERATGQSASNTDLYMGHFLGGPTAAKVLSGDPNASAASFVSTTAVTNNPTIFKKPDGSLRTVGEVKELFARQIEPKSAAYGAQSPSGG